MLQRWMVSMVVFGLAAAMIGCGGQTVSHMSDPTSSTTALPEGVPSGATVFANLDDDNNWQTCGNCGNDGATGAASNQGLALGNRNPSEDGGSAQFSVSARQGFLNGYWWLEHPPTSSQINHLVYEFDLYVPHSANHATQAIEFECQQQIGGWIYNFAWQADYYDQQWRTFDYGPSQWDNESAVPFQPFTPGTWHHIKAEFHNDLAQHTITHDALTIDGVRYAVGAVHGAAYVPGTPDKFTNAFQLDTNGVGQPYSVFVDDMSASYW